MRVCECECAGGVAHLIFTHMRVCQGDKGSFTETLKGY